MLRHKTDNRGIEIPGIEAGCADIKCDPISIDAWPKLYYNRFPLPSLTVLVDPDDITSDDPEAELAIRVQEGAHAAFLDLRGRMKSIALQLDRRICCMTEQNVALLHQRISHNDTRFAPEVDELIVACAPVFSEVELWEQWNERLVDPAVIGDPAKFRDDFLARRLDLDCARMKVNVDLFEVLRAARAEAIVVVATDNMDCFTRAFEHARSKRRRLGRKRETLADWAIICDDIICSSEAGALKSEDTQAFFGPWLADHAAQFTDAVLIDDRADNCAAFTSQGGTAIQWKMGTDDIIEITTRLRQWLDNEPSSTAVKAVGGSQVPGIRHLAS